jgi:hypothetical protein
MPRVADYSILTDNWWTEGFSPEPIQLTIPKNINKDSRSGGRPTSEVAPRSRT